ncbi:MAG: VWA domain-containing protein [Chloroflexi bacterium]|nr:VWA domain-containing protein [Chloroflexota bacterium]MBP8056160.1 VWA domain-containing protein [Chloroflexota bacterium]
MNFTTPLALLLLLTLPYFYWLARPQRITYIRPRWRDWASLGLRVLIILLLTFSLAGTQTVRAADELAVVFLIDVSDSMGPEQVAQAEAFVRTAIEEMEATDQAAVIAFGANALVDRPMSRLAELAPVTSVPQTLHTDLAEAIRLGLAIFPAGSARRMVILSDGAATLGDTTEAARLAAASGVQIDVVPIARDAAATEAFIASVTAPSRVTQGEAFTLNITAESTANMPATLRVLAGSQVVSSEAVQLNAGSNNFAIRLLAAEQEFARYRVELVPAQDTYFQNNELAAFTEITGPPRVLVVANDGTLDDNGEPYPDEAPALILALQAVGLEVDVTTPGSLPASLAELSNYGSIVLVNVNAKNLSPRKMELLQTYVRDLGGGLVAIGGPQSYGMGGYFQTPLEATLPVDMQIKDQERFPAVSIVIVIDRSGSMSVNEGGVQKIQLAAEGAVRVVELLNDFDVITVIPVDTAPSDPIGPISVAEREQAISLIRQISSGGGGIYVRTGLQAAADALAESPNEVQHIIILADGADSEEKEGVPELLDSLVAQGVTISFVSIGNGPDVPWLQEMAERGGGRFHFTDRAANLPQIFTQETTAIQRTYLIEERFFPSLISRSPILAGIEAVPPLFGYVGTAPKDAAQVILETHQGDPLLVAWQYGLGRSVAWTSDATGRWATDWVSWAGFAQFWGQAVRWTISQSRDTNVETVISYQDENAVLTVDARDSNGVFLNNLTMEANVVSPAGETTNVTLQQVAPGRYEADFNPETAGAYFIRVAGSQAGEDAAVGQTSGWVLGYSPEYQQFGGDPQLLASVAELTRGRDLTDNPLAAFEHNLPSEATTRPIWHWLTLLAVILLPMDIALRRLVVTRTDMQRAWAATGGRVLHRLFPSPIVDPERAEQMSSLFEAKARAKKGERAEGRGQSEEESSFIRPIERGESPTTKPEMPVTPSTPTPAPPRTPATPRDSTALASRLLAKKREQQEARRDEE